MVTKQDLDKMQEYPIEVLFGRTYRGTYRYDEKTDTVTLTVFDEEGKPALLPRDQEWTGATYKLDGQDLHNTVESWFIGHVRYLRIMGMIIS